MVVSVRSGINRGLHWMIGSSTHGCWLGTYETDKQDAIRRLVRPGMTIFDIGANAGFYTMAFSRLVGTQGRVYAFEPLAENVTNLLRHVAINNADNVTVIQAAVAHQSGIVGFRRNASNATGTITDSGGYQVPAISLDDLIKNGTLPVPDVVKMDVEGAESRVLEGAPSLLRSKKTVWFIAIHGEEQARRCQTILFDADYRVYRLEGTELRRGPLPTDEIYAVPA
jgi:FkbM family methyltransferase